jgi:6-phosphogluconolactonase (cycloisomerase 2 family)
MFFGRRPGVTIALVAIVATAAILVHSPRASAAARTFLYASVGAELALYEVDVEQATLTRRSAVTLPANVQESAVPPSRQHLYVAWSNSGASYGSAAPATKGNHGVTAFRIDAATGALTPDGPPAPLRSRSIHLTTDRNGSHLIVAYNDPSGITVHRLESNGRVGPEVPQPADLDAGIYAHHVRVLPSNRSVVLVTRGNGPTERTPEDPGALKVFAYDAGVLKNHGSVAPRGGFGFQARHIDFHPTRPWAFLTLERQNALNVFRIAADSLEPAPLYSTTTLAEPDNVRPGQTASSIHVHPSGRFVYVGNRASATTDFNGTRVAAGGENTIAVFSIDQNTGQPALIQTVDTRGYHPRTFAIDDAGRILVVGNQSPMAVRDSGGTKQVPASLAVFRIGADGRLTFARKHDVETDPRAGRLLFWTGMLSTAR